MNAQDFKIKYPEFEEISDEKIESYFEEFPLLTNNQRFWGRLYDLAQSLWTAHFLTIEQQAGGSNNVTIEAGIVTSTTIGDTSVSYELPQYLRDGTAEEIALATTLYGRKYLMCKEKATPKARLIKSGF